MSLSTETWRVSEPRHCCDIDWATELNWIRTDAHSILRVAGLGEQLAKIAGREIFHNLRYMRYHSLWQRRTGHLDERKRYYESWLAQRQKNSHHGISVYQTGKHESSKDFVFEGLSLQMMIVTEFKKGLPEQLATNLSPPSHFAVDCNPIDWARRNSRKNTEWVAISDQTTAY